MIDIEALLGAAKLLGASDVHITVGVPPKMRVRGRLKDMEFERMMPEETERLANLQNLYRFALLATFVTV